MASITIILIIILAVVGAIGFVFIIKNNDFGKALVVYTVSLIAALAAILAIPIPNPPNSDSTSIEESEENNPSGNESIAIEENKDNTPSENESIVIGENEDNNPSEDESIVIEENEDNTPSEYVSIPIEENEDASSSGEEIYKDNYEIEYEGIVIDYNSYTDFYGHQRKDVIYMEYDGSPSSIIIHTNGNYSNISFDFYAVSGMDPEDKSQLTFIADNDPTSIHEYAAIPIYNSSGSFNEDISGKNEVKITFHRGAIPSEEYTCAVLIDNLSIQ